MYSFTYTRWLFGFSGHIETCAVQASVRFLPTRQ